MKTESDTVFLTGATGFIGSHIARYLLQKGLRIRALKREKSQMHLVADIRDNIDWIEGDLLDIYCLEDALAGIETIIHTAGLASYDKRERQNMMQLNIQGTAGLVNAALTARVKTFIHISSVAALGKPIRDMEVDEKTEWENAHLSAYAISKQYSEREVWRGMAEGLDVLVLNPSVVIGPSFWDRNMASVFRDLQQGQTHLFPGINGFVDIRDLVKVLFTLWQSGIRNERFVISAENHSYSEIACWIAEDIQIAAPYKEAVFWQVEIYRRWEEWKALLSNTYCPKLTEEKARLAFQKTRYSNRKLQRMIDHTFIPIRRSISNCAMKFRKEGTGVASFYAEF